VNNAVLFTGLIFPKNLTAIQSSGGDQWLLVDLIVDAVAAWYRSYR
jgi:hypothetical protein